MNKKFGLSLFRICLSIFLIIFLFSKVGLGKIIEVLASTNIYYFIAAFVLMIFGIVISSSKWRILLIAHNINISLARLISFYFVGMFFNNFLPTGIGGDVVRIYDTAKYSKKGVASLTSVFMERFTGLIALVLIAMVTLGFSHRMGISRDVTFIVIGLVLLCLLLIVVLFNKTVFNKCNLLFGKFRSRFLWSKIEETHQAIYLYLRNKDTIGKAMGISFLFQTLSVIVGYIISLALGLNIPPVYFFLFIPVISVITMIPISLNGIGIREGAYVYFFTKAGVSSAEAFSISLLTYALLVFISLIGGIIYATRSLRKESRQ